MVELSGKGVWTQVRRSGFGSGAGIWCCSWYHFIYTRKV